MWSILKLIEEEWCSKQRRWLELHYDFLLYYKFYYDLFCCCDLSHVLYSSKDPCCSLACGHRRISGRRFSSPKWVERSDDRKYVCVRRQVAPRRRNFCSNSSYLATSSTCNDFLRLVNSIQSAPRAPLHKSLSLQILVLFRLFLRDSCADGGACDICQACMFMGGGGGTPL